ncbi:monocarboxylate transporter 7-like [Lytechinus variegatus]|uniref:monocarboxylate transporter 7-like n=1 Tax=Lytechinus variegatus TaxID=7654 RepID=UPI001BB0FA19|nr:monocarboxylate transporter 7-like [Lytechinus variegatus]
MDQPAHDNSDIPGHGHQKRKRTKDITKGSKRWVILVAVFFVSFFENGIVRAVSLIINDLTREFDVSAAYIGSNLGLSFSLAYFCGFFNILLLWRFSVRQLVMFGGTISSVGLLISSLAQTSFQFSAAYVTYGIGKIFVILPTSTCPKDYFPDRLPIATGTILSGGSAGIITVPWLFENLLRWYGWRGSLLILAGLNCHIVAIGALLEPLRSKVDDGKNVSEGEDMVLTNVDLEIDDEECASVNDQEGGQGRSDADGQDQFTVIQDDSYSYTESQASVVTGYIVESGSETEIKSATCPNCLSKALRLLGFSVFKDRPLMVLCFIEGFLFFYSYNTWISYEIPNALAKGLSPQEAVLVSVTGGVANFIGRLGIGFLWSLPGIRFDLWYSLIFLLSAAAFWTNYVAETFNFVVTLSACFGLLMGAKVTSQIQSIYLVVGESYYKAGVSMFFIGVGLSFPISGAVIGRLYDLTESYDIAFVIIAAVDVTVVLLNGAKLCWKRYRRSPPGG